MLLLFMIFFTLTYGSVNVKFAKFGERWNYNDIVMLIH